MAKPGESLQRLVHAIEASIAARPNVTVESPKRIRDKDTGRLREHDVVVTFADHHGVTIALECRDRSRPVGVEQIEAFSKKCERTGVARGIIVSPSGFRRSALAKAESLNIGCLTLREAAGFDWLLSPDFIMITHALKACHLHADTPQNPSPKGPIYRPDGSEITNSDIIAMGTNLVGKVPAMPFVREGEQRTAIVEITDPEKLAFYAIGEGGEKVPVTRVRFKLTFVAHRKSTPFSFQKYVDVAKGGTGSTISDVAIAPLEIDGKDADIVMATQSDGTTKIVLVPAAKDR